MATQVDFQEAEGEIPADFLLVEYRLFREELSALTGKPPKISPSKTAFNDERSDVYP